MKTIFSTYIGIGILFGLYSLSGCVSRSAYIQDKVESFEYGVEHGVWMSLQEISNRDLTRDEVIFNLKSFLDAESLRKCGIKQKHKH